jgi:hypothetical protein
MVQTQITPPVFDPEQGETIMRPEGGGPGHWAGCPSIIRDRGGDFLLTYRRRRPRGAEPDRGYAGYLARSSDGVHFSDVWSVEKGELDSPSMERFDIVAAADRYLLYISYVDPADLRWRIDVLEASRPEAFDLADRRPVLTAATSGTEGVKDPLVVTVGDEYWLFASFASRSGLRAEERAAAHATADIYNTGATVFPSGLAVSADGLDFDWKGEALPVGPSWDRYQARLTSILAVGGQHVAFYDGSASVDENYEERCGFAASTDLRQWRSLSMSGPAIEGRSASRSVRYVDALVVGGETWCYYEYTCPDGSHELRLARAPRAVLL